MHVAAVRRAQSAFPWLTRLKAAQLQRIARATGIQSSGTKSSLVARIEAELQRTSDTPYPNTAHSQHASQAQGGPLARPLSIVSIDMGIRNLAFAHLRISPATTANAGGVFLQIPELTAWRRFAVSEIASSELQVGREAEAGRLCTLLDSLGSASAVSNEKEGSEAFSLEVYAASAYTLISTLLAVYQPTHVLIERQRFRSGGGNAVQEWTLRVGVLEGMLYAVLHALRQERRRDSTASPEVQGIEPRRVVRYWTEGDIGMNNTEASMKIKSDGKKRLTAREVKNAKIDLVGRWLTTSLFDEESMSTTPSGVDVTRRFSIAGDSPDVYNLAQAYLQKWQGQGSYTRRRMSSPEDVPHIGKLDDLADCLLQGITWLDWQAMRQRLVCEGILGLT